LAALAAVDATIGELTWQAADDVVGSIAHRVLSFSQARRIYVLLIEVRWLLVVYKIK
jgi:hypothetical protein